MQIPRMEALEKMTTTLNGQKRPPLSLSVKEQKKIVRLLWKFQSAGHQPKTIRICRKLLDYGLLTSSVSLELVDFMISSNSIDGLLTLTENISDLPESCLVKMLSFAMIRENGTKPPMISSDRIRVILELLRYPYSYLLMRRELANLTCEEVVTMIRLLNCLFAQLLFSDEDNDRVPSLLQVSEFLNCLLDATSKFIVKDAEFEKEIFFSSAILDCAEKSLSIIDESELRRSNAKSSTSGRKFKDYSIEVTVFSKRDIF